MSMKYRQVERRTSGAGPYAQRVEMERVVETPDNYYPDSWRVDDSEETFDWRPTNNTGLPYRGEPHPAFASPAQSAPVPTPASNAAQERPAQATATPNTVPSTAANPAPQSPAVEGA